MLQRARRKLRKKKKYSAARRLLEDKYDISEEVLGEGSYSSVFFGERLADNEPVAVKVICKHKIPRRTVANLTHEVEILKSLNHEHIVRLRDSFEDPEWMFMVMEYVGGGNLFNMIVNEDRPFHEEDAKKIIRSLASALQHCHEHNIIHRDVKPQNILLTKDHQVKLADFNIAVQIGVVSLDELRLFRDELHGTPSYVAPEILSGDLYDTKCDIWSLGVVAFLLLSGGFLPIFVNQDDQVLELFDKIKAAEWSFHPEEIWQEISATGKQFMLKVLEKDPTTRLDTQGILRDDWFQ